MSLSMSTGAESVSMSSCTINLSNVASLLIYSGALHSHSLHALNSCDLLISLSLCGSDPFVLLGFQRGDW